jgi:hypothetical protein
LADRICLILAARSDPRLTRRKGLQFHNVDMRFFFNLACGAHVFPDRDGEDLPDLEAAREFACASARELMSTRLRTRDDWTACAYEVADQSGQRLLVVRFPDVPAKAPFRRRAAPRRAPARQRALNA